MTEHFETGTGAGVGAGGSTDRHHVVYLTGAPAAGKSTLSHFLQERVQPLAVFEYGARLTARLAQQTPMLTQAGLRAQSSRIATPEDIVAVDDALMAFVARERHRAHVVIDTHAVTKEAYGFRITPFSLDRIAKLRPTMIVMLYTAPEIAVARIAAAPAGRPLITQWEAAFHTELQASVAVAYATRLGIPVYLLDGNRPPEALVDELAHRLERPVPAVAPPAGETSASSSVEAS